MSRGMKPFSTLLLIWMEVLKRGSVELGEEYGVLMCTMALGMSVSCFAGSRMTQEVLFERKKKSRDTRHMTCWWWI